MQNGCGSVKVDFATGSSSVRVSLAGRSACRLYAILRAGCSPLKKNRNQPPFGRPHPPLDPPQKLSDTVHLVHGALMFAAFGLLMPAGAMVARFAKTLSTAWFTVHRGVQVVAVVVAAAGLGLIIYKTNQQGLPHFDNTHARVGLAAACMAFVQPVVAWLRPGKGTPGRLTWFDFHFVLGWGATAVGAAAIVLGLKRFGATGPVIDAFYGYVGVLAGAIVVLSLFMRRKASAPAYKGRTDLDDDPLLS